MSLFRHVTMIIRAGVGAGKVFFNLKKTIKLIKETQKQAHQHNTFKLKLHLTSGKRSGMHALIGGRGGEGGYRKEM